MAKKNQSTICKVGPAQSSSLHSCATWREVPAESLRKLSPYSLLPRGRGGSGVLHSRSSVPHTLIGSSQTMSLPARGQRFRIDPVDLQ